LTRRQPDNLGEQIAATPFALMRRFSDEMNNLFQDFGLGRNLFGQNLPEGIWAPQVEVVEENNQLIVRADLPGLKRDDINVELSDDGVTIEGERKNENEEKGEGFYRSERSYGRFYRRVPLPEGVNAQNAHATFRNGVLEITMPAPKQGERKTRRLEVHGEAPEQAKRKAA
jgi:HSP20 family protein